MFGNILPGRIKIHKNKIKESNRCPIMEVRAAIQKEEVHLIVEASLYKLIKPMFQRIVLANPKYIPTEIWRTYGDKHVVVIGLFNDKGRVKRRGGATWLIDDTDIWCPICSTRLWNSNVSLDHIVPISKGGNNSKYNLILMCKDCNGRRSSEDFYRFLANERGLNGRLIVSIPINIK
jgi:hypothetical protein